MRILNMFSFFQSDVWLGRNIVGFFEDQFLSLVLYHTAFNSVSHIVCVKEENWNALTAPWTNMPTLWWAKHLFGP